MIAKTRCDLEFGEAVRLCSNGDVDSMTRDKGREIWSEMSNRAVKNFDKAMLKILLRKPNGEQEI